MHGSRKNCLIVIESGQLATYNLDDKLVWDIGRLSKDNMPDIRLHCATVSRQHGRFQNIDGMWFYVDKNGKNGTVYNGRRVGKGIRGRVKPIPVQNGDVFIFGGGEEAVINSKTVWAMYLEQSFDERWRVEETRGLDCLSFTSGSQTTTLEKPKKGTVVEIEDGVAIYMGGVTYMAGDIAVTGC